MDAQHLQWSSYMQPDMECDGSFFTSDYFLSTLHDHDFYELCLVIKGQITHFINGRQEELQEGDLLFIRPRDIHRFEKSSEGYFQFINLAIRTRAVDALFNYLAEGFAPGRLQNAQDPPKTTVSKSDLSDVVIKFEAFILLPHPSSDVINTELRLFLAQLFGRFFPLAAWENKTSVPTWLSWLHHEMQKSENFVSGVSMMQKLAGKAPAHICREFKRFYHMTPTSFITGLRLSHARRLLSNSDMKVIDIAIGAGFQSLSHFCHEFKKAYGVTPSEYRRDSQRMIGN